MSDTGSTPSAPAPADGLSSNQKLIGLLGWIFAPLGVIAIFLDDYKADRFVRQNVIQAAGLWLAGYVIGFVLSFVLIGVFVFPIVFIIQIVYGIQAFNGKMPEVPVIYGVTKNMIESA
jgi:uncharacterized membrane protein